MAAFEELIIEMLSENHRVLVFSQFVEMLQILKNWFIDKKINFRILR